MKKNFTDYTSGFTTSITVQPDADGFTRTLVFYQRGPGDPPGIREVWMCGICDQVRENGHAPDCPRLVGEAT
jgi:hypothetical protein